ncbi:MAG: nucleotidyltransferase domain-containing protein [Desulfatiglandales bacterium]
MEEVAPVGVFDNPNRGRPYEKRIQEIVGIISRDLREGLESIVLYGSYVAGDFVPGSSDINFLILLKREEDLHLDRIRDLCKKIKRKPIAEPLVLSEDYINHSLDTFPLEYLNISRTCKVLYGSDFILNIKIKKSDLRLQCEREIKAKLLLLRQIYFSVGVKDKALKNSLLASWKAIGPILRGIYFILFSEFTSYMPDVITRLSTHLKSSFEAIRAVYEIKTEKVIPPKGRINQLYKEYLHEFSLLAEIIDEMEVIDG